MIIEWIKPLTEWTGLDLVPLLLVAVLVIACLLLAKRR